MSLVQLIKLVLSSWQVLAVTVAIVLYFFIVSYMAKSYHRPRSSRKPKGKLFKKKEKPAAAAAPAGPETTESDGSHVDDLGIEEA